MKKIKLLKDIDGYMTTFKAGDIFESDEPYSGFNEDGSFTICQGMGIYIDVDKNDYEIV